MDPRLALARLRRPAAVAALAGIPLVTVVGLAGATAADPFVAGQPAARSLPLPDQGRAATAEARRLLVAIGLRPPDVARAERLRDRLEGATYDQVTFHDAKGRPTIVLRLAANGGLRHLARLEAPAAGGPRISPTEAAGRAMAVARAAGLDPRGSPLVRDDPTGAWAAAWTRVEAGVPVLGDGTWVRLDGDGSVRSVAEVTSALAPHPSATLSETEARRIAESQLDRMLATGVRGDVSVTGMRLAWVAPNDTFAPERPDAPQAVRRLAWVVMVDASGQLGERLHGLELDIDAGTGELLGGDTLE